MILIELQAAVDHLGTLRTFYVSDEPFQTEPLDAPSSVAFEPRLENPGEIGLHIGSRLELGEIVLLNGDGQLDAWLTYGFDGRRVVIRTGRGGTYPNAFQTILTGTVQSIEASFDALTIRLRDRQFIFDRPALTSRYAGTNSLPNGVEGTASDLKGKTKPKTYGKVFNVSPPCVNTSKLIYQVNDGAVQAINGVYDRGGARTAGADYATNALLQAANPSAGTFATCLAEGFFKLGGAPIGQVTADVTQGATAADRTTGQILRALALGAGVAAGDVASADLAALDAANSSVVGVWIEGETTFQEAMDQVASSAGAHFFFDPFGLMRVGRLEAPGAATFELTDYAILEDVERCQAGENGLPIWTATVRHSKVWTVQDSDLDGSVTAASRAFLAEEYRSEKAEAAAIKTQFLLAGEMYVDTLLTSSADAAAEAARLLAMHKVRRDIFDVPAPLEAFAELVGAGMRLGHTVSLKLDRFGMAGGRAFRLIGQRIELADKRAVLSLWG